jgi:hypothetical protein
MSMPSKMQFHTIRSGYHADPSRSLSLRAEAYTDPVWFAVDQQEILSTSWQWGMPCGEAARAACLYNDPHRG